MNPIKATEAAVAAVQQALGCERGASGGCLFHSGTWPCNLAVAAADAAAPHIAAQTLRDAANELYGDERAEGPHYHPLSVGTWLRARADRIEASHLPPERATA